jgi:molybdate transport system substrate-binding protein
LGWAALCAQDVPQVAAAADLRDALTQIADRFLDRTGHSVILRFGSSGAFTAQIEHGAPYQIFFSADEAYVRRLATRGFTEDEGRLYGVGRLALFVPKGSPLVAEEGFEGLHKALLEGRIAAFVIPDPAHAPYGRAARAALRKAALWKELEPKLRLGEDAADAARIAAGSDVQGGLIPLALSKSAGMEKLGTAFPLPPEWHASEPLRQRVVLLKKANATARAFLRYLETPEAEEVLLHFGFTSPRGGVRSS